MSRPASLAWFAQHEIRLAWRDWTGLMTGGKRSRAWLVAFGALIFAVFLHVLAYHLVGSFARAASIRARQP